MTVHHVTLTVLDAERSAEWYERVLGPADVITRAGDGWHRIRMTWPDGLVIGVTAFVFYALFRNKVQRLISDLEVAGSHVVGLIALNYKRRETSRATMDEEI